MRKLFEIPIYAFSPENLYHRVNKYKKALQSEYAQTTKNGNPEHGKEWLFLCCHPFQLWQYNHIVGYIVVSYDVCDVYFDVFLQAQGIHNRSRYFWKTKQKWFLENQHLGGYHFRLNDRLSNDDIRERIHSWLEGLIKDKVPKKYYVDHEAFDTVDKMIDYTHLMRGE